MFKKVRSNKKLCMLVMNIQRLICLQITQVIGAKIMVMVKSPNLYLK